jgi:hypothetical protein
VPSHSDISSLREDGASTKKCVTRNRTRAALRSELGISSAGEVFRADWAAWRQLACLQQAGAFQERPPAFEAQGKQKAAATRRRAQPLRDPGHAGMAVPRRKDKEAMERKSNDVKSLLHTAQKKVAYQSGAGAVSGDVVVAIEFQFVEGGGNAEPAGHGGGLQAGDAGFADDHYISTAHGAADQDYFQFDDGI